MMPLGGALLLKKDEHFACLLEYSVTVELIYSTLFTVHDSRKDN